MVKLIKMIYKKQIILVSGIGIVAISLAFFALSVVKPNMGIQLTKGQQGWVVGYLDATGLAQSNGIKVGDKPVEINGQPAQVFLEKYDKDGTVFSSLINELTVTDNQGQSITVSLNGHSPPTLSIIESATSIFLCIAFWIVGFYVFLKKPKNQAALLLYFCGLTVGLIFSANSAATQAISIAPYIEGAATLVGPWLLMHFFLVLPDERTGLRDGPRIFLLYLPVAITLILFISIGIRGGQPVIWFRSLRYSEYALAFIFAVGVAIYNYAKATLIKTRQQMKIVLIGCLAALIPVLFLNVLPQAIWGYETIILPSGFSVLFIVFIPLAMGYAIINQKLMDIDVVLRRSVIYGLITIVMTIILSTAILISVNFQKVIGVPQRIFLALVLGGIATALFGPTKKGIEFLVDKYLYKDRYDYRQIIKDLNTSLNGMKDFSDTSRLIVATIVRTLNLEGGCLFVKTQDGSFELSATQGTCIDNQDHLLALISHRNCNNEFPNLLPNNDENMAFLIPLTAGEKEVGILYLSQKRSRQDFSSNDLFLIEGLASVAAMSLHNAMLIRDVSIRDTFVSIASHELRTPLTSVSGYAELLMCKDPPEATRKQWLQHIISNSQQLTDMVDDLLNVTRIQSGKIVLKIQQVALSEIVEERLAVSWESTEKHQFAVDIEQGLPDVLIDRDKFGEVISNLLSNAVKYSPKGGCITISARHELQTHHVVVSVTDEGIGIGPEDRDLLFTTFHRIQRPETQGIRGSGLGLYIAKEWTKAMGGDIWLKSELNKGATFFVAVPTQDS
jgi:signal transduction histidine kinase